jgi:hypothetical protein
MAFGAMGGRPRSDRPLTWIPAAQIHTWVWASALAAGWAVRMQVGVRMSSMNGTAHSITNANSVYQPGQLILQCGFSNEYAIVRWTAPFSGTFSISATFSGLSSLGDSADVHILLDDASIFDSNVIGTPDPESYSGLQNVAQGDTIDFVVGSGPDKRPAEDNTSLSATIQSVPEPNTVLLTMGGLLGLLCFRKRTVKQLGFLRGDRRVCVVPGSWEGHEHPNGDHHVCTTRIGNQRNNVALVNNR